MGANASQEQIEAPRPKRSTPMTLAELGIVRAPDNRILVEAGWTTNVTAPLFVAHRDLGIMQLVARKSEGIVARDAVYLAHRVNPFKRERQSALELYLVPAHLCVKPRFGIVTFSPDAGPRAQLDGSAAVSTEYGAIGSDAGYVQILTNSGIVFNLNWRKFQLCMTLKRGDPELVRKLAIIDNKNLANMNDIEELLRAVRYFERCFIDASPWCNTRLCDEDAWGDALEPHRVSSIVQPVTVGDGRPVGAPAIAELVLSSKTTYGSK